LLATDSPVALDFIFTSCPTICPVMTASFARMYRELGAHGDGLRMVSISIDPEYDTPRVLRRYAASHGAGSGWSFLTGNVDDVVRVQRAFGVYAGRKMNHRPVVLLKGPGTARWVRITGLASGSELASEYRRLLSD